MVLSRLERVHSGTECSCSPYSSGNLPAARRSLRPRRALSLPLRRASTLDITEEVIEPESELLSRDLLEDKFSGKHGSQISKLQTLERLKGDMKSALLDLEEPLLSFSVRVSARWIREHTSQSQKDIYSCTKWGLLLLLVYKHRGSCAYLHT